MSDVVVLDTMPVAAGLYARALSPQPRPAPSEGLPDRMVNLVHHRSEVADVAAYDRVCGFTLTDRLPATWLYVLSFPLQLTLMVAPDFPLPPLGLLHVRNRIVQHRPAMITDPLDLVVRAGELRPHRRGVLVDLISSARSGGQQIWEGRSTYLNRSASLDGTPAEQAPPPTDGPPPEANASEPLPTAGMWDLSAELGRRYAAVSGDVNPIHLSSTAAKAFGLPRMIAHGMWTHARLLAALQPRLPDAFEVAVNFRRPVPLPSVVRFGAGGAPGGGWLGQLANPTTDSIYVDLAASPLA